MSSLIVFKIGLFPQYVEKNKNVKMASVVDLIMTVLKMQNRVSGCLNWKWL